MIFVFLHLIGFASLFGGAFTQIKGPNRVVNAAMFHGAILQLVSGLALQVMLELGDGPVPHIKLGIKLVVLIVIGVLVIMNRRKPNVADGPFWAIFALTVLNAALAVFWTAG